MNSNDIEFPMNRVMTVRDLVQSLVRYDMDMPVMVRSGGTSEDLHPVLTPPSKLYVLHVGGLTFRSQDYMGLTGGTSAVVL